MQVKFLKSFAEGMRVNFLTSFAAGMLLTTSICAVVYFSDDQASAKTSGSQATELSKAEMKKQLESAGYVVQTKAEYELSLGGTTEAEPKQEETKTEEVAPPVTQVVVNVAEGMTSIDVGNTLQQAGLVQNAFQFSKDVESRGVQNNLRPGSYTVDSSMTLDQIIAIIFP